MAERNRDYGKFDGNGNFEYAPLPLVIGGENFWTNLPEKHLELGYLPVIRTEKPEKEGFYYTEIFVKEGEKIFVRFEEHEILNEENLSKEEIEKAIEEGVNSIDE